MLFNTPKFLVFLGLLVLLFVLSPKRFKAPLLLLASYVFYGFWDWRFTFLLAWSTIIDFYCGRKIYEASDLFSKKRLLILSIVNNLLILGFFKYYNFFLDSFVALLSASGLTTNFQTLNIILPVGISFYTFQTMSYTIDIYRGELKPTNRFMDFALFVAFFPQLVAGPIERAANMLPQIEQLKPANWEEIKKGAALVFMGFIKKVLISDNIAKLVDQYFQNYASSDSIYIFTGLILFSFQIYMDFSGYSDIARGISKWLGIDLMKNFNQPYFSTNITEFWRRWHISLSTWLKDYLYIPLGGNRGGRYKTYFNLMATMVLGGLWHGASWNFILWGFLHGLYLMLHKMYLELFKLKAAFEIKKWGFVTLLKMVTVYLLVLITWLPFRSSSINETFSIFKKIVFWQGDINTNQLLYIGLMAFVLVLLDLPAYLTKKHTFILNLPKWMLASIVVAGLMSIAFFMYININEERPFIYFQF